MIKENKHVNLHKQDNIPYKRKKMEQYYTVRGTYENGKIHLFELPTDKFPEKTEVIIMFPVKEKRGIKIKDFINKGNYCAVGGDALNESEDLYMVC